MRLVSCLIAAVLVSAAADKKPPEAQAANRKIEIKATLYSSKEAVKEILGSDLGGYFQIVKVEIAPKAGALAVSPDDFLLRSYKDGQKSQPFAPSQIAGRGALVVSSTHSGGAVMAQDRGPVWGGIPGTGDRPRRMGAEPPIVGNASAESSAKATFDDGGKAKDDPLLAVLKKKILPEKETGEPVSGFLYFSLEGKHKPKDLNLQYRGPAGKLDLEFR